MHSSRNRQWRREQTKIQDAATPLLRLQHIFYPYYPVSILLLSLWQQSHFVQFQHKISFLQFNNRLNLPFPPCLYPLYRLLYQQRVVPSATPSASNPAIYQLEGSITQTLCRYSRTKLSLPYSYLIHSHFYNEPFLQRMSQFKTDMIYHNSGGYAPPFHLGGGGRGGLCFNSWQHVLRRVALNHISRRGPSALSF
jgi:hypothetical protein